MTTTCMLLSTTEMTSKCSKLCIETSRLRFVFEHFDVIFLVDKGKDHEKLLSVCCLDL